MALISNLLKMEIGIGENREPIGDTIQLRLNEKETIYMWPTDMRGNRMDIPFIGSGTKPEIHLPEAAPLPMRSVEDGFAAEISPIVFGISDSSVSGDIRFSIVYADGYLLDICKTIRLQTTNDMPQLKEIKHTVLVDDLKVRPGNEKGLVIYGSELSLVSSIIDEFPEKVKITAVPADVSKDGEQAILIERAIIGSEDYDLSIMLSDGAHSEQVSINVKVLSLRKLLAEQYTLEISLPAEQPLFASETVLAQILPRLKNDAYKAYDEIVTSKLLDAARAWKGGISLIGGDGDETGLPVSPLEVERDQNTGEVLHARLELPEKEGLYTMRAEFLLEGLLLTSQDYLIEVRLREINYRKDDSLWIDRDYALCIIPSLTKSGQAEDMKGFFEAHDGKAIVIAHRIMAGTEIAKVETVGDEVRFVPRKEGEMKIQFVARYEREDDDKLVETPPILVRVMPYPPINRILIILVFFLPPAALMLSWCFRHYPEGDNAILLECTREDGSPVKRVLEGKDWYDFALHTEFLENDEQIPLGWIRPGGKKTGRIIISRSVFKYYEVKPHTAELSRKWRLWVGQRLGIGVSMWYGDKLEKRNDVYCTPKSIELKRKNLSALHK